jgi:antitoxin component of MazEF toxin-antitoxin module
MVIRLTHVVQPYWVGTKDRKSLAMIIPAQIVKEQNLNTSTILAMRVVDSAEIILKVIDTKYENKEESMVIAAGKSLEHSSQQERVL